MDHRLGRIAGLAAFAIMVVRLGRLMVTGSGVPAWHLIMIASAFLGGVIWWLLSQTISSRRLAVALFTLGGTILFLRMAVPQSLLLGLIPTPETLQALRLEMAEAIQTIRFGLAPVVPTAGIVAILAALMWVVGGLFVWGSLNGSTVAMTLPSLILYLQFAVMDRRAAGMGWMVASVTVIGLSVISLALERRSETGRVRNAEGRPIKRQSAGRAFILSAVLAAGALFTTTTAAGLVPFNGNFPWRLGSGYGPGVGGTSYDRLADLQQHVISRRGDVMFRAALDEDAPPGDEIYWQMETLETFDGSAWRPNTNTTGFLEPGRAGGESAHRYRGSTQRIAAFIQIEKLRMIVVPTAGIAYNLTSDDINLAQLQVTTAGSLIYDPTLIEGTQYTIEATLPLYEEDIAAMATGPDGELTPMFAAAAAAEPDFDLEPVSASRDVTRPADIDRFLGLPDGLPLDLRAVANTQTAGAQTNFERAWLLQYWFKDSGDFTYSQTVTTGHAYLNLQDWLTDPESPNYRTGYCQQFAASMAVLGRVLGIPSRVVWGFTPGEVVEVRQDDEIVEQVIVRDRNAHSWVEMWIDGFGWVRFDPTPRGGGVLPASMTASFDPTIYLPVPQSPDQPNLGETPEELLDGRGAIEGADQGGLGPDGAPFPWPWLFLPLGLLLLVALVPGFKAVRRRRRLARLREGDITAAWEEIVDQLSDLGQPVPAYQTPMEFANSTDGSLVLLARNYSAAVYGGHNGMAIEADIEVVDEWLRRRYEPGQRTLARFNPRSLFDRRGSG